MLSITHIFCSKGGVTETAGSGAQTVPVNSAFNTSTSEGKDLCEGRSAASICLSGLTGLINSGALIMGLSGKNPFSQLSLSDKHCSSERCYRHYLIIPFL